MTEPPPDPELDRLASLPVAVVSDVLDRMGLRSQAMAHAVRPLDENAASLAGRAFTIAAVAGGEAASTAASSCS